MFCIGWYLNSSSSFLVQQQGTDPELDQNYNVDTAYEGSVFRLFVKGSRSPYLPDEDFDLVKYCLSLSLRS